MTGSRRFAPIWTVAAVVFLTVPDIASLEPTDPLAALRNATRDHHQRVDRLMDLRRLQDPEHYARVLQVLDAFLAGWEPLVAAALPASGQAWLQRRSRRPFLQQDLRVLGLDAQPAAPLPPMPDPAAAWGSIYVLEGSALGGQFIARFLARAGLDAARGAAYFHGWGDATGAMWREVRDRLASELATPAATASACEAARQTFDALAHLLEKLPHERTAAA
jgi:heme oxygenase